MSNIFTLENLNDFSEKIVYDEISETNDSYFKIIDDYHIHIIRKLDFLIFTYNFVLHEIKINIITKYRS